MPNPTDIITSFPEEVGLPEQAGKRTNVHSTNVDWEARSLDPTTKATGESDLLALEPLLTEAGSYIILSQIGRGGMGVVYLAHDRELGRPLALKVMLPKKSQDLENYFIREARITSQLQHPGIPPVHGTGRLSDGRPFFAMRLVAGKTLHVLLAKRATLNADQPKFLTVFHLICQIMAYAHSRHVVHRDLKPQNIMVGAFGEVQVMDWGLAKVLNSSNEAENDREVMPLNIESEQNSPFATKYGNVIGTVAYMSPEQARGESVDPRADVFALGAILAEILTGQSVDQSLDAEDQLERRRKGELTGLASLDRCGAPDELISLTKSCLAVDKADRPRNAGELARTLDEYHAVAMEEFRAAEMEKAAIEARENTLALVRAVVRPREMKFGDLAIYDFASVGGFSIAAIVSVCALLFFNLPLIAVFVAVFLAVGLITALTTKTCHQ